MKDFTKVLVGVLGVILVIFYNDLQNYILLFMHEYFHGNALLMIYSLAGGVFVIIGISKYVSYKRRKRVFTNA